MARTKRTRLWRRAAPEPALTDGERQGLADELTAWWLEAEHVLQPGAQVDGRACAVRDRYGFAALKARLDRRRPELADADETAVQIMLSAFVSWTLSYEARQLKIFLRQRAGVDDAKGPVDLPVQLISELRNEARTAVAAAARPTGSRDPYADVRRELAALMERGSASLAGGAPDAPFGGHHGGHQGGFHGGFHGAGGHHGHGDLGGGGGPS
jgi:hypothetical protein